MTTEVTTPGTAITSGLNSITAPTNTIAVPTRIGAAPSSIPSVSGTIGVPGHGVQVVADAPIALSKVGGRTASSGIATGSEVYDPKTQFVTTRESPGKPVRLTTQLLSLHDQFVASPESVRRITLFGEQYDDYIGMWEGRGVPVKGTKWCMLIGGIDAETLDHGRLIKVAHRNPMAPIAAHRALICAEIGSIVALGFRARGRDVGLFYRIDSVAPWPATAPQPTLNRMPYAVNLTLVKVIERTTLTKVESCWPEKPIGGTFLEENLVKMFNRIVQNFDEPAYTMCYMKYILQTNDGDIGEIRKVQITPDAPVFESSSGVDDTLLLLQEKLREVRNYMASHDLPGADNPLRIGAEYLLSKDEDNKDQVLLYIHVPSPDGTSIEPFSVLARFTPDEFPEFLLQEPGLTLGARNIDQLRERLDEQNSCLVSTLTRM